MYVYGKNATKEVINKIKKVYLSDAFKDTQVLELLKDKKIEYVNNSNLDKMVKGNHQGIIAEIDDYKYTNLEDIISKENCFLIILDHIEDPHNLGAIVRTCEAAGVDGIIIPKNRSVQVNETVMKVSAGTLDRVKIACVTNLNNTIKDLKQKGFWFIGTDMNATDYKKIDYSGNIAIVIGNEGSGMNHLTKQQMDFMATIPMKGTVNSLNASVAAGIIIFEASTRR